MWAGGAGRGGAGSRSGAQGGGSRRGARWEKMAATEAAERRVSRQEQELRWLAAEVGRLKEREGLRCAEGCSPELQRLRAENEKLRYRLLHLRRSLAAELARAAPAESRAGSEVAALGARRDGRAWRGKGLLGGAGWERTPGPGHGRARGLGAVLLPTVRALRRHRITASDHRSLLLLLTGPCKHLRICGGD